MDHGTTACAGSVPRPSPRACDLPSHPFLPPFLPCQGLGETEQERVLKEEAELMRSITQKAALKTYAELAKDIKYTQVMKTGWKPPLKYRLTSEDEHQVRFCLSFLFG